MPILPPSPKKSTFNKIAETAHKYWSSNKKDPTLCWQIQTLWITLPLNWIRQFIQVNDPEKAGAEAARSKAAAERSDLETWLPSRKTLRTATD